MLIYVNTTIAQSSLNEFLDKEARADLVKNKAYFEAFPHIAFQITSSGDGFKTKIVADYFDLNAVEIEKVALDKDTKEKKLTSESATLDVMDETTHDSTELSLKSIEDAALIEIDDIILDDLDAKVQADKYESGELKFEVGIKNGVKHGNYTEYSEAGNVIVKGQFKNDQRSGLWKFYDDEGNLLKRKRFK